MRLQITAQALQLVQHASSLLGDLRNFGRDMAELMKLEAKLAVRSAVSIAIFGIAVVLLLFTGWILLISSLVAWLAKDWLDLPSALLLVSLVIIVSAVPFVFIIKRHAGNVDFGYVDFKATRRQLGLSHDTAVTQPPRTN